MDKLTQTATKHLHPRKPILFWQVSQNGVPIFRNNSVAICRHWMELNGFKTAKLEAMR